MVIDELLKLEFFSIEEIEERINQLVDNPNCEIFFSYPEDITPRRKKNVYGDMELFKRWSMEVEALVGENEAHYSKGKIIVNLAFDDHVGRYEGIKLYLPRRFHVQNCKLRTPVCKIEIYGVADSQTPLDYCRNDYTRSFFRWISDDVSEVFPDSMFKMEEKK